VGNDDVFFYPGNPIIEVWRHNKHATPLLWVGTVVQNLCKL